MKVIIMRGISGSGKTSLALQFKNHVERDGGKAVVVSSDDYFMKDGVYRFDATQLRASHGACMRKFIELMDTHRPPSLIVVDNTNTRVSEAAPYYSVAEAHHCKVLLVTIHCPPELAMHHNVHRTPPTITWKQYQRIISSEVPPWWKHEVAIRNPETGSGCNAFGGFAADVLRGMDD